MLQIRNDALCNIAMVTCPKLERPAVRESPVNWQQPPWSRIVVPTWLSLQTAVTKLSLALGQTVLSLTRAARHNLKACYSTIHGIAYRQYVHNLALPMGHLTYTPA